MSMEIGIFILGVLIGVASAYLVYYVKRKRSPVRGVTDFVEKQQENKRRGKENILDYLEKNENIANNNVEKLLGVSDATASRYLTELEEEGKIKQIGERGRFVSYRLKI